MDLTKFYENIQFKAVEMGNNNFPKFKAFVRLTFVVSLQVHESQAPFTLTV